MQWFVLLIHTLDNIVTVSLFNIELNVKIEELTVERLLFFLVICFYYFRERDMDSKVIIHMENKKTTITNPAVRY